ncbi:MAG: hypothetical protein QOF48_749, partial [Verrucomicrobiota bacterium]
MLFSFKPKLESLPIHGLLKSRQVKFPTTMPMKVSRYIVLLLASALLGLSQYVHGATVVYDLSAGFSASSNPSGPWAYGWKGSLGGTFTPLTVTHMSTADGGQSVPSWQLSSAQTPAVYKNTNAGTITFGGGAASVSSGTIWFYPGEDGRPENFGAIRFTVPPGGSGDYTVQVTVAPTYPGPPQGETDIHVIKNGTELFGQNLVPSAIAGYTNTLALTEGQTVDFAIGRGLDGSQYGSGLRIAGSLSRLDTPQKLVLPPLYANTNGPGASGSLSGVLRLQEVYDSGLFPPGIILIKEIRWRPHITIGAAFNATINDLQINLSTTLARGEALSTTFASNVGSDDKQVFRGSIALSSAFAGPPAGPKAFDIIIPLAVPFLYNPASGNLLVDLRNRSGSGVTPVDGASGNPDGASRVYSGNPESLTAAVGDTGADILQLVFDPTNAPPPPPPTTFDLAAGFSPTGNPNGPWSYGWETNLGGIFKLLTVPRTSPADNGVSIYAWQYSFSEAPVVFKNATTSTATSDGGAGTFPPGTMWFYAGANGTPYNYCVIRFTVPAGAAGNYQLGTAVRSYLDGAISGDTDFHVLRNGTELFARFLPGNSGAGYTNILTVATGDTIDFAIGRGADGNQFASGLKIAALLTLTTNTPPPPPPTTFDLAAGFSPTGNPNGPWSYGWKGTLDGNFTPLTVPHISTADAGQTVPSWQLTSFQTPAVYKNTAAITVTSGGASFPAGSVWYFPGENGRPENLGIIRFTVPAGAGGNYDVRVSVGPVYDGSPQGDTDFHVARNGTEVFGRNLTAGARAGFTNIVTLNDGDSIDFAIGRGADGSQFGSGLKIAALLTLTTNVPAPAPTITRQPESRTVNEDSAVSFEVLATGVAPLVYEWYQNGRILTGASTSTLSFPSVTLSDVGQYQVKVSDVHGSTWSLPATLSVAHVNHAPIANAQSVSLSEDTSRGIVLSGSDADGDAITFELETFPSHGILSGTGANRTYVPAPNFHGMDSFTFRATDGSLSSMPAAVTIIVRAVNDAPAAHIEIAPLLNLLPTQTNLLVLSLNNSNARVILDASGSFDLDHDTLQFHWLADGALEA